MTLETEIRVPCCRRHAPVNQIDLCQILILLVVRGFTDAYVRICTDLHRCMTCNLLGIRKGCGGAGRVNFDAAPYFTSFIRILIDVALVLRDYNPY